MQTVSSHLLNCLLSGLLLITRNHYPGFLKLIFSSVQYSIIPIGTKRLVSACIPLFILSFLLSGCTTVGGEKKSVSGLYVNLNTMALQNEILQASIVEKDKMMVELSGRLNKLADKFETVLAEKNELQKTIEMSDEDFAKPAEDRN